MRLASGNGALTATSWGPSVESCPEGPTRLDREIRVGVPARRADGSGRRTAGRWVAPSAVAAVRFKRPSGRGTRLSRARLGKATGVPRGADDPQGPIGREQAGSPVRHPDGALGGCPSQSSGHPHRAPARIGHLPRWDPPAASVPVPAGHCSCPRLSAAPGVPQTRSFKSTSARPVVGPGGLFGVGYWGSSGRTLAAWGPFGPDVTSNSTACPSASER